MSFLGKLFGAGPDNYQKTSYNQLNAASQNASNTGMGYLADSSTNFKPPVSYYSSILSGNPADVAGAVAPQINQIQGAYQQNKQQVDQFAPMGGGRAALSAQLPYQKTSAITNLISQARQNAAQGLTNIAGTEGGIGSSLLGVSAGAAGSAGGLAFDQHKFDYNAGNNIGQAIGAMIAGL
jgi:hypothetical protein